MLKNNERGFVLSYGGDARNAHDPNSYGPFNMEKYQYLYDENGRKDLQLSYQCPVA